MYAFLKDSNHPIENNLVERAISEDARKAYMGEPW